MERGGSLRFLIPLVTEAKGVRERKQGQGWSLLPRLLPSSHGINNFILDYVVSLSLVAKPSIYRVIPRSD